MSYLIVLVGALALTVALYLISGGHLIFFGLPLVLAGPLVWRGGRRRVDRDASGDMGDRGFGDGGLGGGGLRR